MRTKRDVSGWKVRWDPELAQQALANGEWPGRTVAEYALDRANAHPDRIQIVDGDLRLTCGELVDMAQRLAAHFIRIGLRPGDVVSFQLPNWHEVAVITLAAALTGVVLHPILTILRDAEVAFMLNDCASKLIFVPEEYRRYNYRDMINRIGPKLQRSVGVILVRSSDPGVGQTFESALVGSATMSTWPQVDPDAVKQVMYTSGTTGRPKGVLHSHNTIHGENVRSAQAWEISDKDVFLVPSPIAHVSGGLYLNMCWFKDVPLVLMDTWDPVRAITLIRQEKCTVMAGATPFLQGLVDAARLAGPIEELRVFTCGGAGVPPALVREANCAMPNAVVWRAFGATEVPTLTAPPRHRDDTWHAAETDGRVWRAQVRIVDPLTGEPVAAGAEGEILARCSNMGLGYLNEADNAEAYDEQGFFRTGDLGRILDDEYLLITGRKKDLIVRSGENISPKEIEDVLFASDRIADVAVVAMPSPKTGEGICAFIVPAGPLVMTLDEVAKLIERSGMARQKTPERLIFVDELPRTASGKVRKDILREQARQSVEEISSSDGQRT